MEEKLRQKIKQSGYKKKYLAERLRLSNNYLSMCFTGKRNLSETKQNELNDILNA